MTRIAALEKVVGTRLFRSGLREHGKAEHPDQAKDAAGKQKVLQVLESAVRGVHRLNAVKKRVDPKVLEGLLAKVPAPPLAEIGDMKKLRDVVLGALNDWRVHRLFRIKSSRILREHIQLKGQVRLLYQNLNFQVIAKLPRNCSWILAEYQVRDRDLKNPRRLPTSISHSAAQPA